MVRFGISETQTPFSLPLSLSHPSSSSFFHSLFLSLAVSLHAELGGASQKVFQGLEPFQPLTAMAVQMWSCDLGNSPYPTLFLTTGGGDVAPDLCSG